MQQPKPKRLNLNRFTTNAYTQRSRVGRESTMAFTPIETQEAFDAAIKDRLAREKAKHETEIQALKGQITSFESQIASYKTKETSWADEKGKLQKSIGEKDAEIAKYQTNELKVKVAKEAGLPYELADRISGADEEAMQKDAAALKAIFGTKSNPPAATEHGVETGKDAALRNLAKAIVE